jgi:hypothetical protein
MATLDDATLWAQTTFGEVDLGDHRRTQRLVKLTSSLAETPAGQVTAAVRNAAEREGAFRLLANEHFSVDDLGDGVTRSTLKRCFGVTYCPVDGSSITLSDSAQSRDVGKVGAWSRHARGLLAVTSLAVDSRGAPVGVFGPQWWARTERSTLAQGPRKPWLSPQTEIRYALSTLRRIEEERRSLDVHAQLWFQLDRGYDAWPVFQLAQELDLLLTVRSCSDRRIETDGRTDYLYRTVRRSPLVGFHRVHVPERPNRPARDATLAVRIARVRLVLRVGKNRNELVPVSVVYAEEQGRRRGDRLRWILLTTAEITDIAGARAVINGYTTRWLVEDLHRAWKNGWVGVERTQLRRRNSICKWATLHLALAARALRLARLARSEPHRPSDEEFSRDELDAVLLLKTDETEYTLGSTPPLGDIVTLLAEIGGYDKYSKKPPGATVIGRGLERISLLARGVAILRPRLKK